MAGFDFLWTVIIGLLAGFIAGGLMKSGEGSMLTDMLIGIAGSFLGGYIFSAIGVFPGAGLIGSLITAVVGAMVLLFFFGWIRKI